MLITACPVSLFSQQRNYTFSIGVKTGFVYGQALELLYQDSRNSSEFLSELKWDMKPVFYLGLHLDIGKTDIMSSTGFFSSLSFKIGIPGDSGIHENRDWMSTENAGLTHFSSHTNKTHEFYWLDAAIGMSIPVKSYFYINPFISGSWMRFSFSGRDGEGIYARCKAHGKGGCPFCTSFHSINDNPEVVSYNGQKVITYKQDWLIAALGITVGTKVLYPFTIDFSFKFSPLTYCIALDEHLSVILPDGSRTVKRSYRDYTRYGFYLEPGVRISYSLKRIDFSLEYNFRYIGKTRGITYINNSPYPNNDNAGGGLSLFDINFLVKFRF